MIKIRVTKDANPEIEVAGNYDELIRIEQLITDIQSSEIFETDQSANPHPYDYLLSSLKINVTKGSTCISINDNDLIVTGSKDNLQKFASFFHFNKSESKDSHNHFEYFDGNKYVDPLSLSLVISIDDENF